MKRPPPPTLFLALLAALAVQACVHENPQSLQLAGGVVALRLGVGPGISGECYPENMQLLRSHGTLDLMTQNLYEFFPLVRNLMPRTTLVTGNGPQQLRTDASTVHLKGAAVSLEMDTSSAGPFSGLALKPSTGYYVHLTGTVVSEGLTIARFPLITSTIGEQLRTKMRTSADRYTAMQRIVAHVKVEGEMQDGTVVQTNTIDYPLDLCWGCLVHLDAAEAGVGIKSPEEHYAWCSQKPVGPNYVPPCVVGNDEYVPCGFYCTACDLDGSCDERYCPPN